MSELAPRLGDLIDDYCPRCRLLLNHAIASMVEGKVAKVICQTCHSEHAYRQGEGGKKKKPSSPRSTLFDQVLARSAPSAAPAPEPVEGEAANKRKKKAASPARYISRHTAKPPRKSR